MNACFVLFTNFNQYQWSEWIIPMETSEINIKLSDKLYYHFAFCKYKAKVLYIY